MEVALQVKVCVFQGTVVPVHPVWALGSGSLLVQKGLPELRGGRKPIDCVWKRPRKHRLFGHSFSKQV